MNLVQLLQLLLLAALWGASFLFMRVAAPEFGPVPMTFMRTAIAALFLLPVVWLTTRKHLHQCRSHWPQLLAIGLLNTAIPFCLFGYTVLYLGAGVTSIINATAPIFAALIAFLWLKDKLSASATLGLGVGLSGVVVLVSGQLGVADGAVLVPAVAAMSASAFYGFAGCFNKRYMQGVSPMVIALASQFWAALVLAPAAWFTWPEKMPSTQAWWQIGSLGAACTGIAFILYFRLIAQVGITKAISVTYLIPLFGVFWSMVFLQEQVSMTMAAGGGLILVGVALTTGLLSLTRVRKQHS